MISAWQLDESQIADAAEDMIREHGDEALTEADDRVRKLKSEGFESVAITWALICEVIKDQQKSDAKIHGSCFSIHIGVGERIDRPPPTGPC